MQADIKEILVIIPPGEEESFRALLGDGKHLGVHIEYLVQPVAKGLADAFILGESFIGDDNVCLILGDNIFYQNDFEEILKIAQRQKTGAVVFGYWVEDPRTFGVVEFDQDGQAVSIEEKPTNPKSNYIIPGLYFYDNNVVNIAKKLEPSLRGELEITDVNLQYLQRKQLKVISCEKGLTWMDAGTADSLLEASLTIKTLQESSQCVVGCIEEIAYRKGFISLRELHKLGESMNMTKYGKYLLSLK